MFSAQRKAIFASIPSRYSGLFHLAAVNVVTVGACIVSVRANAGAAAREWLWLPLFWLLMSFVEWSFHRGLLHHRHGWPMFRRPHLSHHVYFTADAMEFHTRAELRMVLFPLPVYPFLLFATAPVPLFFLAVGRPRAAIFFELAFSSYYWAYEWTHVLQHARLPAWLRGRWPLAYLRRHHRRHHHRHRHGNYASFLPLADYVCGTLLDGEPR